MSILYLVWKNLTRKKLRLILLIISITIAFLIFVVLTSFKMSMDKGVDLTADDRLVVMNKIHFTQNLPFAYVNRIKALDHVISAIHLNWFGGMYQNEKNFLPVFAISSDDFFVVYDELFIDENQFTNYLKNRQGLLVGEATAKKFDWKVGDRIPLNSNIFTNKNGGITWDFDIEGIYRGKQPQIDTTSLYFHYQYFNESITFGKDKIGFVVLRTTDVNLNEAVIRTIDSQFENTFTETKSMPEKAFNKQFVEQLGNISLIIQSVVFSAFFTILMLVGNSMMIAIRERNNEIAVMKTLGFSSTQLFVMVLLESTFLVFIGGMLGIAFASLVMDFVNNFPGIQLPQLVIDTELMLLSISIMLGFGFVTGVIPASNALRMNIVKAFSGRQ